MVSWKARVSQVTPEHTTAFPEPGQRAGNARPGPLTINLSPSCSAGKVAGSCPSHIHLQVLLLRAAAATRQKPRSQPSWLRADLCTAFNTERCQFQRLHNVPAQAGCSTSVNFLHSRPAPSSLPPRACPCSGNAPGCSVPVTPDVFGLC